MKYKIALSYITCFLTGACTLIIELVSFRILAPYFGTSSYVAGIIINIVLAALALGYYIGGLTADKFQKMRLPFIILLSTSVYLYIFYLSYPALLESISKTDAITGSALTIFSMFFLPVASLAFIPTYLIRILIKKENIGKTAGLIYSLSTIGSIAGGITTTFVLIPFIGSSATFFSSIILMFVLGVIGLTLEFLPAFILIVFLPVLFVFHPADRKDFIYSKESEYNIIKVKKEDNDIYVCLNNYIAYFSKSLNEKMLSESYYDYFLFGTMINDAKKILILGNGAGTSMIQLTHFFDAEVDGVEIDKDLTETGKRFFALHSDEKKKIIHEDARVYLNKSNKLYDIVIVDLYNGGTYIPFHLATTEFFQMIEKKLSPNGIMIINIPYYALNTVLEEYYNNSIRSSFKNNYLIRHVLYAFKGNIGKNEILKKLNKFENNKIFSSLISEAKFSLKEYKPYESNLVFTDNRSEIEKLTYSIIKR